MTMGYYLFGRRAIPLFELWGRGEVTLASTDTFTIVYPRRDTLLLSKNTSTAIPQKLGTDGAVLVGTQ